MHLRSRRNFRGGASPRSRPRNGPPMLPIDLGESITQDMVPTPLLAVKHACEPSKTITIGHLSDTCTSKALHEFFDICGLIESIEQFNMGDSDLRARITFKKADAVLFACMLDGFIIDGVILTVGQGCLLPSTVCHKAAHGNSSPLVRGCENPACFPQRPLSALRGLRSRSKSPNSMSPASPLPTCTLPGAVGDWYSFSPTRRGDYDILPPPSLIHPLQTSTAAPPAPTSSTSNSTTLDTPTMNPVTTPRTLVAQVYGEQTANSLPGRTVEFLAQQEASFGSSSRQSARSPSRPVSPQPLTAAQRGSYHTISRIGLNVPLTKFASFSAISSASYPQHGHNRSFTMPKPSRRQSSDRLGHHMAVDTLCHLDNCPCDTNSCSYTEPPQKNPPSVVITGPHSPRPSRNSLTKTSPSKSAAALLCDAQCTLCTQDVEHSNKLHAMDMKNAVTTAASATDDTNNLNTNSTEVDSSQPISLMGSFELQQQGWPSPSSSLSSQPSTSTPRRSPSVSSNASSAGEYHPTALFACATDEHVVHPATGTDNVARRTAGGAVDHVDHHTADVRQHETKLVDDDKKPSSLPSVPPRSRTAKEKLAGAFEKFSKSHRDTKPSKSHMYDTGVTLLHDSGGRD